MFMLIMVDSGESAQAPLLVMLFWFYYNAAYGKKQLGTALAFPQCQQP